MFQKDLNVEDPFVLTCLLMVLIGTIWGRVLTLLEMRDWRRRIKVIEQRLGIGEQPQKKPHHASPR